MGVVVDWSFSVRRRSSLHFDNHNLSVGRINQMRCQQGSKMLMTELGSRKQQNLSKLSRTHLPSRNKFNRIGSIASSCDNAEYQLKHKVYILFTLSKREREGYIKCDTSYSAQVLCSRRCHKSTPSSKPLELIITFESICLSNFFFLLASNSWNPSI